MENVKKTAFMIQAHKDINPLLSFAKKNSMCNFYIHIDKKSQDFVIDSSLNNVFWVHDRVDVKWGGFSQVEATIILVKLALENKENEFFHFISGEDVVLQNIRFIEDEMNKFPENTIFMENYPSKKDNHRVRFNFLFANTLYQRSILNKIIIKLFKFFDIFFPKKHIEGKGGSWFSARKQGIKYLIDEISDKYIKFFKKKICADEHFFQYILNHSNISVNCIKNNYRYIQLDSNKQNRNNPDYLNLEQIVDARSQGFWFARKVKNDIQVHFYEKFNI